MDWTGGYVADIGYTAGFYRETAPSHLAFAALCLGKSPGRAYAPKKVLEIGFGQGFGLALLAAANPDVHFEGYDFNPEHVSNARRLASDAGLQNLEVVETSFEDAAARGGGHDLDVAIAHGIFSWVSHGAQDAIVSILRQRLEPDGVAYVSYNCMPGWAPLAPLRQFMMEVKRRNAGSSERQLQIALDLLTKMKNANAAFFAGNPAAARQLESMLTMDRGYLAHEYLDENWHLFRFSEIVAALSQAKLSYLASAALPENFDNYTVQADMKPLMADAGDLVMRETLRDFASNRRFRRDIFARGTGSLSPGEHRRLLAQLGFVLAVPRSKTTFKFAGPLTELTGSEQFYRPVIELLDRKIASFEELLALPPFGEGKIGLLLDCLALLVHSGQVLPVPPQPDSAPAQRFNRAIVERARRGRFLFNLASPVARTGVAISDFGLLALAAMFEGENDAGGAARHALRLLKDIGRRPMKDGKLIQDDGPATAFLEENIQPILSESVPAWQRLGLF